MKLWFPSYPKPPRDFDKEPVSEIERDCARWGHCWHVKAEQHTVSRHRDDFCCWCGKSRCVQVQCRPTIPDGEPHRFHGQLRRENAQEIGWESPS